MLTEIYVQKNKVNSILWQQFMEAIFGSNFIYENPGIAKDVECVALEFDNQNEPDLPPVKIRACTQHMVISEDGKLSTFYI